MMKLGWREWAGLPLLGISKIKAKIDTGAKTSAIHTEKIEVFYDSKGRLKVRFVVLPLQNKSKRKTCEAEVVDRRIVSDSGGHRELRWVIQTPVKIGDRMWPIELTLTNREKMRFRMLLGRSALKHCQIFPSKSYLCGQRSKKLKNRKFV
jgi:hypothetical protein